MGVRLSRGRPACAAIGVQPRSARGADVCHRDRVFHCHREPGGGNHLLPNRSSHTSRASGNGGMEQVMAAPAATRPARTWHPGREARQRHPWRSPLAPYSRESQAGLVLAALIVSFAAFGPYLVNAGPDQQNLAGRLAKPVFLGGSWDHPFGTDQLGRDLWVRMATGLRLSLGIGFAVTMCAGAIGVLLGLIAAVTGRRVDRALAFMVDVQIAIPAVILAIAASALFSPGLWVVVGVLTFSGWVSYQRVVRT